MLQTQSSVYFAVSTMYSVVEFPDETVEIVAQTWVNERDLTVSWPPYKQPQRYTKAVLRAEDPQPSWQIYQIVRVMGKFGK